MKHWKIQIVTILCFASRVLCLSNYALASDFENSKANGYLHGRILNPLGLDLSSVMIQVIGVNSYDNFSYYTSPNSNGEFNFDGILPPESFVQLYIWDGSGFLNSTTLSAYVSKKDSKTFRTYDIAVVDLQYTQNIAQIYHTTHDMTHTGLCGVVNYFHSENNTPVKVLVYDRYSDHKEPLVEQSVDDKNRFCAFNLQSISGSDMYDFVVKIPNESNKTFTFYLPQTTFVHDAYLDTQSVLYRPIAPYAWQENLFLEQNTNWTKLSAINLATSEDYTYVLYDDSSQTQNLFYFPLSNELLEVSHFLPGEKTAHLFSLLPRTKLFEKTKMSLVSNDHNDSIYIDYKNPLTLKFMTEDELIKLNANYYFQTWNEKFGSVFLNLDLSQFNVKYPSEIKLSLRNLSGQDIGVFEELLTNQNQNLIGFFLNLFPGRYQLFVLNLKNEPLWIYEIRSYPNRVQILTNDWNEHTQRSVHSQNKNDAQRFVNQNINQLMLINTNENSLEDFREIIELQKEKVYLQNNRIYKYDSDVFCKRIKPENFLDLLITQ